MPGPDRPRLTAPGAVAASPGEFLAKLQAWRGRGESDQSWAIWGGDGRFSPAVEPPRGRVRVGFWSPCLGLGGAEAWQLALAKGVDTRRIAWAGTVVIEGRGAVEPRMASEFSRIMPVGFGLESARELARACDVILSWAMVDVGRILAGLGSPPGVVMACHFPSESPWGVGTTELLRPVERFVAVSELALEGMPPELRPAARTIWNAVDPGRLAVRRDRGQVRAGWGVPAGARVAGYLGRLAPEKDPHAMIRLIAGLPEPWHAVLVGEGREGVSLEREADRVAPGRVHLVGGDPAAGDVLNAFDVLVVPSRHESFGLTMAEGLWLEVPVIATRAGLAKLAPGLVREVPFAASGRDLAQAVLADHPRTAETRARVARGRAFAVDRLNLDRFGREWTDLLLEVASKHRRGGS